MTGEVPFDFDWHFCVQDIQHSSKQLFVCLKTYLVKTELPERVVCIFLHLVGIHGFSQAFAFDIPLV